MTDLSDFLLARYAAEEEAARVSEADDPNHEQVFDRDVTGWFDPARVLAECVAKRRIVETFVMWQYGDTILSYLATPYSDHPDYREEWKP